jgi:uncharacterized protein YcbX
MASLDMIYRYPVKGLSPERLDSAVLTPGQVIPGDRRYAIENGPSGFDPAEPRHAPKQRYLMLMRNAQLATLDTGFDDATSTLTIRHDGRSAAGDLATERGRLAIETFLTAFMGPELRGPLRVLEAPHFSFSDVAAKVVSIINLASVADLERILGVSVDPLRFRANLYVSGWPAWSEFDLVGRDLRAGPSVHLTVRKRIKRCAATDVDPVTGERDLSIPATLLRSFGHADCGIYAEVRDGGAVTPGDAITALSPVQASLPV